MSRRTFLALAASSLALACAPGGRRPRIGLALGGGGAKGLAHIAILEVLDELGIRPYRIAGTSIGAIIGALYAAGLSGREIRGLVTQFLFQPDPEIPGLLMLPRSLRWLDFLDPAADAGGLLSSDDFIAYIGETIAARRFRDLHIPLAVAAAELWSGEAVVLESGELLPALQASMALPGVFAPVHLDGRELVDGGVANPLPYELLMDDCDPVIAVDVSGDRKREGDEETSFVGVLFHSFHTMSKNIVEEKLKLQKPHIYVRPDIEDVRVLEFFKARQVLSQAQPTALELKKHLRRYSTQARPVSGCALSA